jgi:circadian clock protein KaiB
MPSSSVIFFSDKFSASPLYPTNHQLFKRSSENIKITNFGGINMGARVVQLYANGQAPSDEWAQTDRYVLRLYIAGNTPRSESTIELLHRNLDKSLGGNYELTVHDVLEEPQLAEDEKILATPTLVKISPQPARRVIGDLAAMRIIFKYLDLPFASLGNGDELRRDNDPS